MRQVLRHCSISRSRSGSEQPLGTHVLPQSDCAPILHFMDRHVMPEDSRAGSKQHAAGKCAGHEVVARPRKCGSRSHKYLRSMSSSTSVLTGARLFAHRIRYSISRETSKAQFHRQSRGDSRVEQPVRFG